MCYFVQGLLEGNYRSTGGQEVIQLCDIQARRRALMIYSEQGAVNGQEIDQDLKYGQRIMSKNFDQDFDFDGRWMDSDWMDSHLAAFGLCPQLCFPNRIAHNLHLSPARLKSDFFLICAFVHFFW